MKKLWKPLILIIVIGLVAADLFFDYRQSMRREINTVLETNQPNIPVGTSVGELAPDFTGTTIDGETIRLRDQRGKVVLINDFASWCGPCLAETPHLVEVFNANSERATIIGLNLLEGETEVAMYRDDFQITYPLVLDPNGDLTEIYKPIGLPTSWFIDPDGVVRYVHAGPMTADMIQRAIEEVSVGREPDLATLSG